MAKSKNSTNKNQISKAHRNGIKKIKLSKYVSNKGANQRYLRNKRKAYLGDPSIQKNKSVMKRVESKRKAKK